MNFDSQACYSPLLSKWLTLSILLLVVLGPGSAMGQPFGREKPASDTAGAAYSLRERNFMEALKRLSGDRQGDSLERNLRLFTDWFWMELSYHNYQEAQNRLESIIWVSGRLSRKLSRDLLLAAAVLKLHSDELGYAGYFIEKLQDTLLPPAGRFSRFDADYLNCEFYFRLGLSGWGLPLARRCVESATQNSYPELFYVARLAVAGLLKKDSAGEALQLMQQITRRRPPRSAREERAVAYCYALIYDRLGRFDTAEIYFHRVMELDARPSPDDGKSIFISLFFPPSETVIATGEFDLRRGKFRAAQNYLQSAVRDPRLAPQPSDRRAMESILFQAFQSTGDYGAATQHFSRYKELNDSVIKFRDVAYFANVFFGAKGREDKYRVDSLLFRGREEKEVLRRARVERRIILAGASVLLVASAFVLWAYRVKRRSVFQLRVQQDVIHRQNQVQQQLLAEKDKLLAEKDLLMREIHHRIKNNLNIVLSLLESQALFLTDPAAKAALQDTENRIRAVVLLHQKLHASADVEELDVHTYVLELIDHLYETFDTGERNFVVTHDVEPLYLDTPEVLPLAVILNEAITNAIKYAFPNGRKGEIHIRLKRLSSGMVEMQIRDNGVGFPAGFQPGFGKTLGFTLIAGLTSQLGGTYRIENGEGVSITIQFRSKGIHFCFPFP